MTTVRVTGFRFVLLVAAVSFSAACDGGDKSSPTPVIAIYKAENSGDGQSGPVGEAVPAHLRVLVKEDGVSSPGVTVAWSTSGGGSVVATGPTDAEGIAEAMWTLGTIAGEQAAQATVQDATGSPVSFTATARPGPAERLIKAVGDRQQAQIGSPLPKELGAIVGDEFGNAIAGVTVLWVVESGDATAQPTSSVSGEDGVARTAVTLGSSTGTSVIAASSEGVTGSPVRFTATARLYVFVEDNYFSPAELTVTVGTTVTWYWAESFAAHNVVPDLLQPTRSGDPVAAPHEYSFTFDTPGTYQYYCQQHGLPGGSGMSGVVYVTP